MGRTKINYVDYTFNPWSGCAPAAIPGTDTPHPGCLNCFARRLAARFPERFGTWGPAGERKLANGEYWKQPRAWDRAAKKAGERRRVLCGSMCDVFDRHPNVDMAGERRRLWNLIWYTPWLDWLLLTKRPQNARKMLQSVWSDPENPDCIVPNLWLGYSASDQASLAAGLRYLLRAEAAAKRFLSLEPLLGPLSALDLTGIDWVIVGGESGPGARPCDIAWIRSIVAQCREEGVPCWVKQIGANGSDMAEWPEDVRVRDVPCQNP